MAEEEDGETTFSPTNLPKEHLNTEQIPQNNFWGWQKDGGHEAPRTAAHCLQKEVGQNIADKKTTKALEIHPGEGVIKEEKFSNTRKSSHQQVYGEFWNPRGQHTGRENK